MLIHPTLEKLRELHLTGMVEALSDQLNLSDSQSLSFDERLGLLVDREETHRQQRRLKTRLRQAGFQQQATFEDIDWKSPRGLDQSLLLTLGSGQWIEQHHNCLITGPTGVGKSWIATALAHKACRLGYSARYLRLPRLAQQLLIAKGDGSYSTWLKQLARVDVILFDDWGLAPIDEVGQRDLLEILDDRFNRKSTIITSQLPIARWHDYLGHASLADAILDRLVHNAYKIQLKGESMRKQNRLLTAATNSD